jgi:hypothetical protein
MRIAILLCCVIVSVSVASGQQTEGDPYSLGRVKAVLDRQSGGIKFGWDYKFIPTLGDRCAIAILKTIEEPDLVQPKTVKGILRTLHLAFARPELIQIKEGRKPSVTLFLINHLSERTQDPEIHLEIEKTTEFVKLQSRLDTVPPIPRNQ